ncbi:MAG: ketopantoate reductase C-terminal domain-containing protein [Burkholderiales bacterium]
MQNTSLWRVPGSPGGGGFGTERFLTVCVACAEQVGRHKTSVPQDVDAGRDPETNALVIAVIELRRIVGVPTPRDRVRAGQAARPRHRREKVYIRAHAVRG